MYSKFEYSLSKCRGNFFSKNLSKLKLLELILFINLLQLKLTDSINLYIELNRGDPNFIIPNHGNLSDWEKQGVLLLNTCLTVVPHEAESHIKINLWNNFMVNIFKAINEANPYCIYLLLGAKAQAWIPVLGPKTIKLSCSHPSPFSFRSTNNPCYGSNIFLLINQYLKSLGQPEINWNLEL